METFTINGVPVSTTNSQQIIQIPVKGATAPTVPAIFCPSCKAMVVDRTLGPVPKRPAVLKSKEAIAWMKSATEQLSKQRTRCYEGPVNVSLDVYRVRNAGDVDNFIKGALDALVKALVLRDDSQVITVKATKHTDAKKPRVVVTVEALAHTATMFDLAQ